jgi:hypothetical protein
LGPVDAVPRLVDQRVAVAVGDLGVQDGRWRASAAAGKYLKNFCRLSLGHARVDRQQLVMRARRR